MSRDHLVEVEEKLHTATIPETVIEGPTFEEGSRPLHRNLPRGIPRRSDEESELFLVHSTVVYLSFSRPQVYMFGVSGSPRSDRSPASR